MFVGVGAQMDGTDFKTKKSLKEAIQETPEKVHFYSTSTFTPFSGGPDKLEIGTKYSVVGPDPYTSRKWYATVEKLANGKVTVK